MAHGIRGRSRLLHRSPPRPVRGIRFDGDVSESLQQTSQTARERDHRDAEQRVTVSLIGHPLSEFRIYRTRMSEPHRPGFTVVRIRIDELPQRDHGQFIVGDEVQIEQPVTSVFPVSEFPLNDATRVPTIDRCCGNSGRPVTRAGVNDRSQTGAATMARSAVLVRGTPRPTAISTSSTKRGRAVPTES